MKDNKLLISIIVPVYNVEEYICRCINSVLSQSFDCFELILVNDGSKDNSGFICDKYAKEDRRIHVIHKENGGQSSARNQGIEYVLKNSDSSWITFIDSDDWISSDYLSTLYESMQKYHTDISCCAFVRAENESYINIGEENSDVRIGSPETIWLESLHGESYPFGKLFPIAFFKSFRFTEGKIYEDTASIHELLFQANSIVYTPSVKYFYFINPNSTTTMEWNPKKLDALWAHEQQIQFFKNSKYKKSYKHVLSLYIACIAQSLDKLRMYNGYVRIRLKYRIKLKYFLLFKSDLVNYSKYNKSFYYKNAYPLIHKVKKCIKEWINYGK